MEVDLSKYPMVKVLIEDLRAYAVMMGEPGTPEDAIAKVAREFDTLGPYHFAKSRNLLVNNSGEEFACQFMAFYNEYMGYQAY